MDVYKEIKSAQLTNSHGEVNFLRIEDGSVPEDGWEDCGADKDVFVVGHSESGHNHVLEREGVTMRQTRDDRGFQILHAIVTHPVTLRQQAGAPHAEQTIQPGEYIITNNVETSPFTKQARRVAD